jgi:hypothetical protein
MAVAAVLGVLLITHRAVAQDPDSVRAFLNGIYAQYSPGKPEPDLLGSTAGNYFTPPLLDLIRIDQKFADGEVGILNHDPFCACQDYEDLKLKDIEVEMEGGSKYANAKVYIKNLGRLYTIKYQLAYDAGRWLIDDIQEDGIPSLQAFLKHGLEKYSKMKFGAL